MTNRRHDSLGEFEQAVLLAVAHLDDDAYGVTIRREIESRTRRTVAVGALYTALDRLERKGLVTSTMSDPTPERGGRSKRHFTITSAGERQVAPRVAIEPVLANWDDYADTDPPSALSQIDVTLPLNDVPAGSYRVRVSTPGATVSSGETDTITVVS